MKKKKTMTIRELYKSSDSVKLKLKELFDVKCKKCGSNNVEMQTDESCNEGGSGCKTCGSTFYGGEGNWSFWLGLKCLDCGNAKVIFKEDNYWKMKTKATKQISKARREFDPYGILDIYVE